MDHSKDSTVSQIRASLVLNHINYNCSLNSLLSSELLEVFNTLQGGMITDVIGNRLTLVRIGNEYHVCSPINENDTSNRYCLDVFRIDELREMLLEAYVRDEDGKIAVNW